MKNSCIITIGHLLFSITLYAQTHFELTANSNLLGNGEKITLIIRDDLQPSRILHQDSAIVTASSFTFIGQLPRYSATAKLLYKGSSFEFVLDSGRNMLLVQQNPADKKPSMMILSESNEMKKEVDSLYRQYTELYGDTVRTYPANELIKVLNRSDVVKLFDAETMRIINQHPQCFYTLLYLNDFLHSSTYRKQIGELLAVFHSLDAHVKQSAFGSEFYETASKMNNADLNTRIGMPVPDFSVSNNKGRIITNKQLKGSPYVIAFSATWCIPCQEYQKELLKLYNRYRNKGLQVIYFNLDDNDKRWHEHIVKNKLTWTNVSEHTSFSNSKIARKFFVSAIPTYFLIDKTGSIIYNPEELDDPDFNKLESYIQTAFK